MKVTQFLDTMHEYCKSFNFNEIQEILERKLSKLN